MRVPCPAARTTTAASAPLSTVVSCGLTDLLGRRRMLCAGGLGLEPRLHGSKGRRAADYPIPHPRHGWPRRRRHGTTPAPEPRAAHRRRHARAPRGGTVGSCRRTPYGAVGYGHVALVQDGRRPRARQFIPAPGDLLSAPALTRPMAAPRTADPNAGLPANALGKEKGALEQIVLYVFVVVAFLALAAVVPAVWGWGLSWLDVGLAVGFYFLTLLGVTVGYHRYFTHGSFKAVRPLRLAPAAIGCMAIQGPVIQWVADHRRHHAYSDREGDPHSPWRYGDNARALVKGMFHAHLGWLFDRRQTNAERYAPDLLKDNGLRITSRLFSFWAFLSFALPAVIGGLVTHSWTGAWSAFFWAGLVRVALLHHVTWSINSVCHVMGNRPFVSPGRDRATNFWPLAVLSAGESWHNLHHADPTCARHGVLRGQIDISARVIWAFEKLGWAHDVKWPDPVRLAAKRRLPTPVSV